MPRSSPVPNGSFRVPASYQCARGRVFGFLKLAGMKVIQQTNSNPANSEKPNTRPLHQPSAAKHPGQLLKDLGHLRIEVQVALLHVVEHSEALPQFRLAARVIAALLREHRQLVV